MASSSERSTTLVGGRRRQPGDLGAQLVGDAAAGRRRCRRRPWPRARRSRRRAGPGRRPAARSAWASASASRRWPLALDVAERLADARRLGLGVGLAPAAESSSSPWTLVGAVGERLLGQRPGLPDEQADDDDRGEACRRSSRPLGPDPADATCSPGRRCRARAPRQASGRAGDDVVTATLIGRPPRSSTAVDRVVDDARGVGRPAGRQLAGPWRPRDRTAASTSACAACRACSASVAAAARFSAMRALTGQPLGALRLERRPGPPRCAAAPRPGSSPAARS